jgi:hypothetical protein
MTDKLIHAFTDPGSNFPPFVNVTRLADGSVRVIVRGAKPEDSVTQPYADMVLSEADWRSLAWSIFAETNDREVADGRPSASRIGDAQINHMVDRFLSWKLPELFRPDGGISFEPIGNKGTEHEYKREPTGTNLLDATQARKMVLHMIEDMPK